MNNYRKKLTEFYFSSHYKNYMPRTIEGWRSVVDRIEWNFGDAFKSLSFDAPILDVACGVGYLEYFLLERGFTNICAIDISSEQISQSKENLKKYGLNYDNKIEFKVIDAFKYLKDLKDHFTVIAMIDVVDHLLKEEAFEILELSYRALKPEGFLIIRTTNGDNPFFPRYFYRDFTHEIAFSTGSITQCLRSVNFKDIHAAYEITPSYPSEKASTLLKIRSRLYYLRIKIMCKLFGLPFDILSEDIVVIARK